MKRISIIKRLFVIALIFLLSINSYAAIVSDNDGAAFITGAEFDTLKTSFQNQIDVYNKNIDSKIDNAIAAYLDGLTAAKDVINQLFFQIDNTAATGNYKKYLFVEKNYQEQKTQIFNNMTWSWGHFGYNYAIKQLKPYIWTQNSATTGPFSGKHWGLMSRTLNSVYVKHASTDTKYTIQPQLEGFIFDKDVDKTVLTNWYLNNNLNISGASVMTGNPNGYRGGDNLYPVKEGIFDGQKINQSFAPGNNLGLGYGWIGFSGSDNATTWTKSFQRAGGITMTDTEMNKWWPIYLNKKTTGTDIAGYWWEDRGSYNQTIQYSNCYITETRANEDSNIYLYNVCDCNIYAHDTNEVNVERLVDFLPASKRPLTSDCVQCIWDDGKKQLDLWGRDTTNGGDNTFTGCVGYGMAFPKIKLKNTYVTQQSNGFNNLNQFKNGYLKFTSKDGVKYPTFYGGLPLYTEKGAGELDTVKITIRLDPTITTSTTNFRVWIKAGEFKNADVGVAPNWTTTDMNNLKKLECAGCTYDTTNKYLLIPKGVKKEITIRGVKSGETLYLRCCENGNYYGGEIKYLGDCVSHYSD